MLTILSAKILLAQLAIAKSWRLHYCTAQTVISQPRLTPAAFVSLTPAQCRCKFDRLECSSWTFSASKSITHRRLADSLTRLRFGRP